MLTIKQLALLEDRLRYLILVDKLNMLLLTNTFSHPRYIIVHYTILISLQMTVYLVCYDLSTDPETIQTLQIRNWLRYLNSLLTSKQRVILVGLKKELCGSEAKSLQYINIELWQQEFQNLIIHNTPILVSSHTQKSTLSELLNEIKYQIGALFAENITRLPKLYSNILETIRSRNFRNTGVLVQHYGESRREAVMRGLTYLHSIGEIVALPSGSIYGNPADISSLMSKFICPAKVHGGLGSRESILSLTQIKNFFPGCDEYVASCLDG